MFRLQRLQACLAFASMRTRTPNLGSSPGPCMCLLHCSVSINCIRALLAAGKQTQQVLLSERLHNRQRPGYALTPPANVSSSPSLSQLLHLYRSCWQRLNWDMLPARMMCDITPAFPPPPPRAISQAYFLVLARVLRQPHWRAKARSCYRGSFTLLHQLQLQLRSRCNRSSSSRPAAGLAGNRVSLILECRLQAVQRHKGTWQHHKGTWQSRSCSQHAQQCMCPRL